ncbi:DUF167 family protein [Ancylobacter terrae]|uniref:DUF167 family protein n=1 Tax=Ancylobacter sp. sgz301288 TaxID=3342077 RepID=UPI00385E02C8
MTPRPWRAAAGGVELQLRVTPRGGRDAIDGLAVLSDGRMVVKARVSAVAEDGKANAALVRLIAEAAGVATSRVDVIRGHTARLKTVHIEGDSGTLLARMEEIDQGA